MSISSRRVLPRWFLSIISAIMKCSNYSYTSENVYKNKNKNKIKRVLESQTVSLFNYIVITYIIIIQYIILCIVKWQFVICRRKWCWKGTIDQSLLFGPIAGADDATIVPGRDRIYTCHTAIIILLVGILVSTS